MFLKLLKGGSKQRKDIVGAALQLILKVIKGNQKTTWNLRGAKCWAIKLSLCFKCSCEVIL